MSNPILVTVRYTVKDGKREERIWQDKSRASSWTDEMRAQAAENARRRYV